MKRVLFLLVALMLAAPSNLLRADNPPPPPSNPPVIDTSILQSEIFLMEMQAVPVLRAPGRGPHRPAQSQPSLTLHFLNDFGVVSVELWNTTTGEYSQSYVDTAAGSATLAYSGTQGNWIVKVTTADGAWDYWEFVR